MKKLSLILAAAMLLALLAACGSSGGSSAAAASSAPETSESAGEASAEAPAAETAEAAPASDVEEAEASAEDAEEAEEIEEPEATEEVTEYLPLEETATFSYFFSYPPMFEGFADGPMDYLMYTESQKRLNVEIDWQAVSIIAANEQFMLMVNSGDYVDCIQNFTGLYTGGVDEALENEILIDLTDLLAENAPEYERARTASETREKSSLTSSGQQAVMFGFNSVEGRYPATGPVIRYDWLEQVNMDLPVTIDDYYEVLKAFQSELGVESPFGLCADGVNSPGKVSGAFGTTAPDTRSAEGYFQKDGKLIFGPTSEGFREYLTTMHQWYEEGIISKDFTADADSTRSGIVSNDRIANGEVGIFTANSKNFDNYLEMITEDGAAIRGIQCAHPADGSTLHLGTELDTAASNMGISITSNAKNPEIIVWYFNYFFTPEGDVLANYGIEGETFNYNDEGKAVYTDLVLNNPDGMSLDVAMCLFGGGSTSGPYVIDHTKYQFIFNETQLEAGEVWIADNDGAWALPNTLANMMNAEESEEYNGIYSDIKTIYEENVLKFIVGDRSLDEFDDFAAQIESLNLDRCTEIAQAAFDRYQAR